MITIGIHLLLIIKLFSDILDYCISHYRLVTPHSQLHFRLLDHSTFRKDVVVGEKQLSLFEVLSYYGGKCENLELTLDLMGESKHDTQPVKVGDLITLLNGMRVDLASHLPPQVQSDGQQRMITPTPLGE